MVCSSISVEYNNSKSVFDMFQWVNPISLENVNNYLLVTGMICMCVMRSQCKNDLLLLRWDCQKKQYSPGTIRLLSIKMWILWFLIVGKTLSSMCQKYNWYQINYQFESKIRDILRWIGGRLSWWLLIILCPGFSTYCNRYCHFAGCTYRLPAWNYCSARRSLNWPVTECSYF